MKRNSFIKIISIFLAAALAASCLMSCSSPGQATTTGTTAAPSVTESTEGTQETTTDAEKQESTEAKEARILVIETTDIHGNIIEASSGNEETFQYRLAYIAHAINEARASGEYDDVILLDGGDLYQGPPVSNLLDGAPIKAAIDVMDYDAVCLGNHEFDWNVTEYCADNDGTVASYELEEYSNDPDIPIVAANLYDAATGERVPFTKDYVILEKAGKRIAVIGYLVDYRDDIATEKIRPYTIDASFNKFNELVEEVNEKEKPDMTFVLTHGDPEWVASSLDAGQVDLVMGGHTHEICFGTAENGIPFMQGYCKALGYASAVAVIGSDGSVSIEDVRFNSITDDADQLYDSDENLGNLDEKVLDISYVAWNMVWENMSEVVGFIDEPVLKDRKDGVCTAGNFVTSVMLRAAQEDGAIAAFYNYGGIRTSFKIPSGEYTRQITLYDIYTMVPFSNIMLLYDITGAELARQLENGLADSSMGNLVSGLTFTYSVNGDKYTVHSITLDDGTEIDIHDEETLWRVCVSYYSATIEGSVFIDKEPVFPLADSPVDNEMIIEQLRKERDAGDGYIPVDTGVRGVETEE